MGLVFSPGKRKKGTHHLFVSKLLVGLRRYRCKIDTYKRVRCVEVFRAKERDILHQLLKIQCHNETLSVTDSLLRVHVVVMIDLLITTFLLMIGLDLLTDSSLSRKTTS